MKKIEISIGLLIKVTLIIVLGLLLMKVPVFAATGKSTAENVRVRASASTDSEVIELLAVNDTVQILGEEGDWYKVTFNGKTGYVSKSFISDDGSVTNNNQADKENSQSNNENTQQNEQQNEQQNTETNTDESNQNNETTVVDKKTNTSTIKTVKIAEDSKIYILPVMTSETIGDLKKDEEVKLVGVAGLWAYIKTDKVNGWVSVNKLSNISEENSASDNEKQQEELENNKDQNNSQDNNDNAQNEDNANNDQNNSSQENNQSQTTMYDEAKTMYVKADAINIRTQSNTNSDIVDGLEINTQVKVVGEENDWFKVEVNGKSGFIRKDLLSSQKTEVTSRDNNFERTSQTKIENNSSKIENTISNSNVQTTSSTSSSGVSGSDIAAYAQQFVGCRYVYGAAGPSSFDCSGLTMYVYKHFGYSLSHSSKVQATQGKQVTGDLQPGDILVFSNDGKTVGHVGIYIGNDKFVHASDSSTGVIISNLHDSWNIKKYWGARRIL